MAKGTPSHESRISQLEQESTPSHEGRLIRLEQAIIQINHFTENIEKLELHSWKSEINADLKWIKLLLAAGVLAGAFSALAQVITALTKGG